MSSPSGISDAGTRRSEPTDAAPGHVVVRTRALERVFTALAARTLGVAARAVSIRIADERGALGVEVRAPFAADSLSVIEAAERVREVVRVEGGQLTGARVTTVRVRITDVSASDRRRVL